jgi:peptide methionine sulfoxide reductase msrA/msrB
MNRKLQAVLVAVVIAASGAFYAAFASAQKNTVLGNPYAPTDSNLAVATVAGGCFWCVEAGFEKIPGVVEAVSGYTGGETTNPTYRSVSSGGTGHTEAVQVYYDPQQITYEGLLQGLWRMMDPTDDQGQFVDRGTHYRPAIFYHNQEEKQKAEAAKKALQESGVYDNPVVIEIVPAGTFYPAEDYHQDYYKKNPVRYNLYTFNSGRYQFIESVYGKDYELDFSQFKPAVSSNSSNAGVEPSAEQAPGSSAGFNPAAFVKPQQDELKKLLSSVQYNVTQEDGTERPFNNAYWDNKESGLYVDVVSGEPLFSSRDQYKSGTGWPSFTRPLAPDMVKEHEDRAFFMTRVEIRSRYADSHLGHVFDDGPAPTGKRYCMNSASMRFIPLALMADAGYGNFMDAVEPVN